MKAEGILVKMPVALHNDPSNASEVNVQYELRLEEPRAGTGSAQPASTEIALNRLVGRPIRLEHSGSFVCIRCGRPTDKLFGEGNCYPCFRDAPENAECIVRPELCEAHLGRGRDPVWEEAHHNQPHAVYLAVSSALKVGVTRLTQIPTRWIDQGAAWAVQIAEVPYRQLAGALEIALKALYTDRTAWQKMLKYVPAPEVDLSAELHRIRDHLASEAETRTLLSYLIAPERIERVDLRYPVPEPPLKVKSVNLATVGAVESTLLGIRGQYLILEGGAVMNIRRHSGYLVTIET
jgi:hypothetical protein